MQYGAGAAAGAEPTRDVDDHLVLLKATLPVLPPGAEAPPVLPPMADAPAPPSRGKLPVGPSARPLPIPLLLPSCPKAPSPPALQRRG